MQEELISTPAESAESMEIELGREGLALILDSVERFKEAATELLSPFPEEAENSVTILGQLSDVIDEAHAELAYMLTTALEQADETEEAVTEEQASDIQRLYDILHDAYTELTNQVEKRYAQPDDPVIEEPIDIATTQKENETVSEAVTTSGTVNKKADLDQIFPSRPLGKDAILDPLILEDPEYQVLIQKHFNSPAALEAALWRLVRMVEEPSKLDKLLGVRHGSIFKDVLKGRTVAEIQQLGRQSGERIRTVLTEMEREEQVIYDYRVFVEWMEELHYLIEVLKPAINATINELLIQYELLRREDAD